MMTRFIMRWAHFLFVGCLIITLPCQVGAATQDAIDIAGRWSSTIGLEYDIIQQQANFTWQVIGKNQTATGKINGNNISASWKGHHGVQSATGTIHLDPHGRALLIKWSNGVTFKRELPPIRNRPKGQTAKPIKDRIDHGATKGQNTGAPHPAGQMGRHFVYDYRVLTKTAYTAVLSVSYSWNPPSVSQPQLFCHLYAKGKKVGNSLKWIPISKSHAGSVLIPIRVHDSNVLTGMMAGSGNKTEEIEFIIKEEGKPKQLKVSYPFNQSWGDDVVTLLSAKATSHSQNKTKIKLSFFCSIDPRHFNQSRTTIANGSANIDLYGESFYQGKASSGHFSMNLLKISSKIQLAESFSNILNTEFILNKPHCDEVRVFLKFSHPNVGQEIFFRKAFKVNLN